MQRPCVAALRDLRWPDPPGDRHRPVGDGAQPFQTVEFPWSQVTAIGHGVGLLRKVAFHLADGTVVAASALPTGGGGIDQSTRRMIDELEARRRAHVETS